jgi:ribonuclease HII
VPPASGRREPSDGGSGRDALLEFDEKLRRTWAILAGIDEAGRGPLAGPLVAAAVCLPAGMDLPDVDDSKKLTDASRRRALPRILEVCLGHGIGIVEPAEIDSNGMSAAVREAFERAAASCSSSCPTPPAVYVVDGLPVKGLSFQAQFVVKGDRRSLSAAAASVIAKVTRDDIMLEAHLQWPQYGFSANKGYGSPAHLRALGRFGPCPIHRMSFHPVSSPGLFDEHRLS